MKKILFLLVLGVSSFAIAAVVPSEPMQIKKPQVTGIDMSKRKIIRKEEAVPKKANDAVPKLQRYSGVVTKDTVDAVENASRLMQDNPSALIAQLGAPDVQFDMQPGAAPYPVTNPNASPAERLSNLQAPSVTASLPGLEFTKEDVKKEQQKALQQLEMAGRKQLGQKQAPIAQQLTVEDIKNSGIDTSAWPENWEEIVNKSQELQKENRKKQLQSGKNPAETPNVAQAQKKAPAQNGVKVKEQKTSTKKTK